MGPGEVCFDCMFDGLGRRGSVRIGYEVDVLSQAQAGQERSGQCGPTVEGEMGCGFGSRSCTQDV